MAEAKRSFDVIFVSHGFGYANPKVIQQVKHMKRRNDILVNQDINEDSALAWGINYTGSGYTTDCIAIVFFIGRCVRDVAFITQKLLLPHLIITETTEAESPHA